MWPTLDDGSGSSTSGVLLVLLAVGCYGLATDISVPLQQEYGPLAGTIEAQLGALAMTAPFAIRRIGGSELSWPGLGAVAALGALGTGIAFGALLARVGAARAALAVSLVPVVAGVAGVVLRDERIAALSLVGMAFVVAGAALTGRGERR